MSSLSHLLVVLLDGGDDDEPDRWSRDRMRIQ
jgi:hypothetical protein